MKLLQNRDYTQNGEVSEYVNNNLQTRLQELLVATQGLDEPKFDSEMRIVNWPVALADEVEQLVIAIMRSTNDVQLRACANVLNAASYVSHDLAAILARAIYDNPNTPIREM